MRPRIKVASIRVTNSPIEAKFSLSETKFGKAGVIRHDKPFKAFKAVNGVKVPYNIGRLALSDIAHFQDLIRNCVESLKKVKPSKIVAR